MKIASNYLPELCASKDTSREWMINPYLLTESKQIAATDGHCLVLCPITVETDDHDGPVTGEALRAARKAARKEKAGEVTIGVNGAQVIPGGPTFPRPVLDADRPFPAVASLMPTFDGTEKQVSFNATLLAAMVKAMGGEGVCVLTIGGPLDPIRVECGECRGLLMPCRL